MPLRLPVDVKAMVTAYLKAHASVTALVGSRIAGRAGATFPQVTLLTFGGREAAAPPGVVHLDEVYLQVDAWGANVNNDEGSAWLIARTVRAALYEMPLTANTRGVVSRVRLITPPHDFADELDRARVKAEYGIFTHPLL